MVRKNAVVNSNLSVSTLEATDEAKPHNEVEVAGKSRRFTAQFKQKVLKEIEVLSPAERGAYLRKKGLYSSHISRWRQQLQKSPVGVLTDGNPGRKQTKDPSAARILQLERENERLNRKLKQAETIIDVQKKLCALLGQPTDETPSESC